MDWKYLSTFLILQIKNIETTIPTTPNIAKIMPVPRYVVLMAMASPEKKKTIASKLHIIHPVVRYWQFLLAVN